MNRSTRKAIIWSVAVHVVLLGGLLWWGLTPVADPTTGQRERQKRPESAERPSAPPEPESPVPDNVTEEQVASKIRDALKNPPQVDPEEAMSELEKKTAYVEKNISEESVADIGRFIQSAYGTEKRAYAPAENPPPGPFDFDSMLPYSSKKERGSDGLERTVETWVDKDGRTLKKTMRKEVQDDGTVVVYQGAGHKDRKGNYIEFPMQQSAAEERMSNVLEMMSRSPVLQKLFSDSVLPVLNEQRRDKGASEEGDTTPEEEPAGDTSAIQ